MTFDERVCEQIPNLRRYALALCREKSLAEDLVQDCLERALRKRHLWRPTSKVKPWLFRMLYRIYLNHRSSARVRRESLVENAGEEVLVPSGLEARLLCRDAMSAIERLPEDQRAALLLIVLENPSYKEASEILGINSGTLRSRISRAREFVRQACADTSDENEKAVSEGRVSGEMHSSARITSGGTLLQRVK